MKISLSILVLIPSIALAAPSETKKPLPGKTVAMEVTSEGFVPAKVAVKKGEQVNLVITRKVDNTCATEIIIDEYAIKKKLPLNEAITVSFVPQKAGQLKYGCAMGKMIGGVLFIE
ncbi:MAG: cupredoxin domain-containing protein [Deltaproteobacteria bacterium]|nr:cupredoxin domain-containing protein [Deltaproteobacteria bacterium]